MRRSCVEKPVLRMIPTSVVTSRGKRGRAWIQEGGEVVEGRKKERMVFRCQRMKRTRVLS